MIKMALLFLIISIANIAIADDRGLTTDLIKIDDQNFGGVGKKYFPQVKATKSCSANIKINRNEWKLVDSVYFDNFVEKKGYFGVKFDSESATIKLIGQDQAELTEESKLAINKSPLWIRATLEYTLKQTSPEVQNKWAGLINESEHPYIDEIAFSVANSSPQYLSYSNTYTKLFAENAFLIYDIDKDLDYVEVIDYGDPNSDENFYSTTKYWKENSDGELYQVEVPKEIYYWYIVHPKITDEIPAYIDPAIVEQNSTHTNNIVSPDQGYFWRDYLYNYNDSGYPKLKYYLQECDIVWNGNNLDITTALGAIKKWIKQTMTFTSNSERPHQPVRIMKKHIGRCGEHSDLTTALSRIALIPSTGILSNSQDHTWNEFWDENWIMWEPTNGYINNPFVYENGWGKKFGSVFEIRSDGVFSSVTDRYSEEWATLEVYVEDQNGNAVDGARIVLTTTPGYTVDDIGFTDSEGKYLFKVGEDRSYSAYVSSPWGSNSGHVLLCSNSEDGEVYTNLITLSGEVDGLNYTSIATPDDNYDDYKLVVNFGITNEGKLGLSPMEDLDGVELLKIVDSGEINLLMASENEFNNYISSSTCSVFNNQIDAVSGDLIFDIPATENWYTIFDNSNSASNPQHLQGWIALYSYNNIGGEGTITGVVRDKSNSQPIAGVKVIAGAYETITANDGSYTLNLYPNNYNLLFKAENFTDYISETVSVVDGGNEIINVELQEIIYSPTNVIAEALSNGNSKISWSEPNIFRSNEKSFNSKTIQRELTGYSIYIGDKGDEFNYSNWSLVTEGVTGLSFEDIQFPNYNEGVYRYAVLAEYSNNFISASTFSNTIFKDKFVPVEITASTNSGDSTEGAEVILSNQESSNSIYEYSGYITNGKCIFNDVYKGSYTLKVSLMGYDNYIVEGIEISDQLSLQSILNETIFDIFGVGVIESVGFWDGVPSDIDEKGFIQYNIYVDDMENPIGSTFDISYDLSSYATGIHQLGVSAQFSTGESEIKSIQFIDGSSIDTELVAHYKFDNNLSDSSGNGYNGVINGNITYSEDGVNGSSAVYDEDGEYIEVSEIFNSTAPEAFTLSWWLYPESTHKWNQQVRAVVGWNGFNFCSNDDGSIYSGSTTATRFKLNDTPEKIIIGEWQNFVYSFESGVAKLYKNGDLIAEKRSMNQPGAWGGLRMGHTNANTIDGKLDELRLWERFVSKKEVELLYVENCPFWGTIEGVVTSINTSEPVEGAVIKAGMFETMTDENGHYNFDVGACSYQQVEFMVDGYAVETAENVIVGDGEIVTLNFEYGFSGIGDEYLIPRETRLYQNFPNPFNPTTTIEFDLGNRSDVRLEIYNSRGQIVKQLIDRNLEAGNHKVNFDGTILSSGVYYYKLICEDKVMSKKMILLK